EGTSSLSLWRSGGTSCFPVSRSRSRAVSPSVPANTALPSGLRATLTTLALPGSILLSGWYRGASHSRALSSAQPVRTCLPSGLNATAVTPSGWGKGSPIRSPSTADQNHVSASTWTPFVPQLLVRTVLPSGLTARHPAAVPGAWAYDQALA